MRRCHSLGVVAVATLALGVPARASLGQAEGREPLRQPTSVPIDLATALASAGGFSGQGDPQILVGALPEWVAARLYVPPGGRVVGSAFLGSTVVGILSVPASSDTILAHVERELQRRGWEAPPQPQSMGGGFRPAPGGMEGRGRRFTLCGERHLLNGSVIGQRAGEATIVMRLSAAPSMSVCHPPPYRGDSRRVQHPTLFNPEGSSDRLAMMECASEGGSSFGTGTRLRTTMSPEAVLEHYGRQLRDSGWVAPRDARSIAGRTWTRPDSVGVTMTLSITITSSPRDSTCQSVDLRMQSAREP